MFGAGTSAFSQPQNRRILRPPGREAQEFAPAESACSGVGGAAKWKGRAQRSLGMELHHRGSQRYIKPAAATLLLDLVIVFVERLPPAMRVRRKKFYLCVEKEPPDERE